MPDPTLTQAHVDALMDIAGWEHEETLTKLVREIVAECVAVALCGVQGHGQPEGRKKPERPGDGDPEPLAALPADLHAAHEALRAEIATTSIHSRDLPGLLRADEVISLPDHPDHRQEQDQ